MYRMKGREIRGRLTGDVAGTGRGKSSGSLSDPQQEKCGSVNKLGTEKQEFPEVCREETSSQRSHEEEWEKRPRPIGTPSSRGREEGRVGRRLDIATRERAVQGREAKKN